MVLGCSYSHALNISFKFRRTEKVVISQKQRRRVHSAKYLHAAADEQRATHGLATARRPDDHMHTYRLRRVRPTRPCPSMTSPRRGASQRNPLSPPQGRSLRRRQMGRRQICRRPFFKKAHCAVWSLNSFLNRVTVKRSPSRLSGHLPSSSSPGHGSRDSLPSERDRPAIWRAFFA